MKDKFEGDRFPCYFKLGTSSEGRLVFSRNGCLVAVSNKQVDLLVQERQPAVDMLQRLEKDLNESNPGQFKTYLVCLEFINSARYSIPSGMLAADYNRTKAANSKTVLN